MSEFETLTCEQIRRVDRVAIEQWGIPGIVLMENAGRGVADVICDAGIKGPVLIACARGNNGGDGLVVARHLHLRGVEATVLLACAAADLSGDGAWNLGVLRRTSVPILELALTSEQHISELLNSADWVVDALLGTGAHGDPREPLASLIHRMNQSDAKKLAIDIPSGLNATTGEPSSVTFRADRTCSFVALKEGFANPAAKEVLGQVHVLDIGLPAELVATAIAVGDSLDQN